MPSGHADEGGAGEAEAEADGHKHGHVDEHGHADADADEDVAADADRDVDVDVDGDVVRRASGGASPEGRQAPLSSRSSGASRRRTARDDGTRAGASGSSLHPMFPGPPTSRSLRAAFVAGAMTLACDRGASDRGASSTEASAPSAPAPRAPSLPSPSLPPLTPKPLAPLQILRFSFSSGVKAKEPVDFLEAAGPGQRVYAHMAFKNTNHEPRSVHVVFRVNAERRTALDLKIDPSQSYRTWAFNTLKEQDRSGTLALEVTDETGQTLLSEKLPIKATGKPGKGK